MSPRSSIAALMAVVLLVALDFGAYRAFLDGSLIGRDLSDLIAFGALPMANVLAIGLMPYFTSRPDRGGGRPALVGFEVCGVAALLLFLGCSALATYPIHEGVGEMIRGFSLRPGGPMFLACASTLLLLPQVALALLGGWLGRRYKVLVSVVVERRSLPESQAGPITERMVIAEGVGPPDGPDGSSPSSIRGHRLAHDDVTSPLSSSQ